MIVLDTHIWVWWVQGDRALSRRVGTLIERTERRGLVVSVISCWEVALLAARGRLELPVPLGQWMTTALAYPGVQLAMLTPEIAIDAATLPGTFHRDPADRLLAATARALDCPLVTSDAAILAYPHVRRIGPDGVVRSG